jgi:4-carboxymuconolactone decarboxylase
LSRLQSVSRDALPPHERRFYDAVRAIRRRPVSGPFIVTMNSSPDLAARIAHLGHYFHSRGQADESILSLRVRSFIALIGARALDGTYEWGAWVNWALEAGIPQDTVDAIREGHNPGHLTAEEGLITELCTQLFTHDHRIQDATFRAALDRYGVQGVVELVVTLGYFAMIAFPLNAFEMQMSSEQKSSRKPFAPLGVRPVSAVDETRADIRTLTAGGPQPRIRALATHDDVPPEHQHFLDRIVRTRGWLSPAFQILMHTPDVAERIANIGAFLLYESVVPPATRALVGLIAARELDSDYVWQASVQAAREAGVNDELVGTLAHDQMPRTADKQQRVLFDFCRALLRGNHHVPEETYHACVREMGVRHLVQVTVTLGYFVMMGIITNAFDVAAEPQEDFKPLL